MAISNDFSFSFSQHKTFQTCRRRWWLSKVAFWGGWDRDSRERTRLSYIGTKMSGLYRLAGSAVHDVAAEAIRSKVMTVEAGLRRFDEIMARGWLESESGEWERDPKRVTNLFEHYYEGAGRPPVIANRAKSRGRAAVQELFRSPVLEEARRSDVLTVERLDSIQVGDVKVFVKLDLAYRTEDSVVHVWDWKTGKPRRDDVDQAYLYGLAAREVLGLPLDEVRVGIAYLGTGDYHVFEVTPDDVGEVRAKVREGADEIRLLLPDPEVNQAPEESFPPVEDLGVCRWCDLFHACKGHRDLGRPDLVLELQGGSDG